MSHLDIVLSVVGDTEESGKTYEQIAEETGLSVKQVISTHANELRYRTRKLDVNYATRTIWKGTGKRYGRKIINRNVTNEQPDPILSVSDSKFYDVSSAIDHSYRTIMSYDRKTTKSFREEDRTVMKEKLKEMLKML